MHEEGTTSFLTPPKESGSERASLTSACPPRVREDGGIHGQDVGEGQESGQARAHLRGEGGAPLLELEVPADLAKRNCSHRFQTHGDFPGSGATATFCRD